MTRLAAVLASARIANAPSVVSNVWLGFMLGVFYRGLPEGRLAAASGIPAAAILLATAAVAIYLAGNFLNDWADREWDAAHRPERALPSGLVPAQAYLVAAAALAAAGVALAFRADRGAGLACLLIVALVVIYTRFHKRSPAAVLAVAGCRALLLVAGFVMLAPPATPDLFTVIHQASFIAAHALGVFAWTVGLSLNARHEAGGAPSAAANLLARGLLLLPLAAMSCWWIPLYPLTGTLALLPLLAWLAVSLTVFRAPLPRFVSALLAGFPLVDLVAALPLTLALAPPGGGIFGSPLLAAGVLVPALAFMLGRLLQRIAPAT